MTDRKDTTMIDRRAALKLIGLAPAAIAAAPAAAASIGAGSTYAIGYQLQAFEGAEFIELTAAPGMMEPLEAFSNSLKVGSWQELHCAGNGVVVGDIPPGQPFISTRDGPGLVRRYTDPLPYDGETWPASVGGPEPGDDEDPPTIAPDDEMQGG